MIHILIVDSDIQELNELKKTINLYNSNWNIICVESIDAATSAMSENSINLFILNSNVNNSTGLSSDSDRLELGIDIRNNPSYKYTPIIYISDSTDKMYDAVNNIHCYSYITVPYSKDLLYSTLDSISNLLNIEQPIEIQDTKGVRFYLKPSNIVYISSAGKRVIIHTPNKSYTTSSSTLTHFAAILPEYIIQCHRQYIINASYVKSYDKTNCVVTMPDLQVPVGRKYKHSLEELLLIYKSN